MTALALELKTPPLPELGRLTVSQISAGLESRLAPMVNQILRIIKDLSGRPENMSVNDLVDFINSEPTTLGRVVSIASSVGYNSSGIEIVSIHHAVSLIGFDRVRTLALSILLLENAQSEFTAEINRELAGAALVSGLVAAEICHQGVPADADLAFICGVLRGYGRMLAATFLPQEYVEAMKLSAGGGLEESFQLIFGLSTIELGREVLTQLRVPKSILDTFEKLPAHARAKGAGNATRALISAADFGLRTAELFQSPDLTSENFEPRLVALSGGYDFPFVLSRAAARELVVHIVGVLECFRCRAGTYLGSVALFRRLDCLAAERVLPVTYGSLFKNEPPPGRAAAASEPDSYEI